MPSAFCLHDPFGWRTHKTPSANAYTSFVSDLVLVKPGTISKHLGKTFTVRSITNWPHCAWARCHHYKTESTLRSGRTTVAEVPYMEGFICKRKSYVDAGRV